MTAAAFVLAASAAGIEAGQATSDACASGPASGRVPACTTIIENSTDPVARVAAYINRGSAYDAMEQVDRALADFSSALDIDPGSPQALRSRAAAYAELGQMPRAIEDFSKVLDQYPGDLAARQGRGLALAAAGDHARAVQDFTRILERDPRLRVARAARAFSLFRTQQYAGAIGDWDRLLADDPSQPGIVYCRGAAKLLSGDESGRADIDAVREQHPDIAAAEAAICPVR